MQNAIAFLRVHHISCLSTTFVLAHGGIKSGPDELTATVTMSMKAVALKSRMSTTYRKTEDNKGKKRTSAS